MLYQLAVFLHVVAVLGYLLVWEERGADGVHAAWQFSLQDSQKDERIGFKDLNELTAFLEKWMKDSSKSNSDLPKEKIK